MTFCADPKAITNALRGNWHGTYGLAPGPDHSRADRSLKITAHPTDPSEVVLHSFAGDDWRPIKDDLRRQGLLPEWKPGVAGPHITGTELPGTLRKVKGKSSERRCAQSDDSEARTAAALRIWGGTVPVPGTLAERYFVEHRALDIRVLDLSHALRWHVETCAVIGLMTDPITGHATGVHRTFLNADDGAKLERKMLGRQGVVRLSRNDTVTMSLGIAEGIEDGLAVLLSGWAPVWVATSAGAVARFPTLAGIEALTIFADADEAGRKAAKVCSDRWLAHGRDVRIAAPGRPA